MYAGATTINEEERQNVFKALDTLNSYLNGNKYLIGSEEPTLADAITFVSVTNVVVCIDSDLKKKLYLFTRMSINSGKLIFFLVFLFNLQKLGNDLSKFPNVAAWFERCKALPSAHDNFAGAKMMEERIRKTLKENL